MTTWEYAERHVHATIGAAERVGVLNVFGREGWELVSRQMDDCGKNHVFTFKRRLEEKA